MRSRIGLVLQAMLWIVIIWFFWRSLERLPTRQEIRTFIEQGAGAAMLAFAGFFLLALGVRTLRFGYLLRKAAPLAWTEIARAFPWLFMIGAITPFRMGDVARAGWMRRQGGSGAHTIGLWIAERATDMLCLVIMGLWGLALAPKSESFRAPLILLAICVLLGYLGLAVIELLWNRWRNGRAATGVAGTVENMISGFAYMRNPRLHGAMLGLSLLIWTLMASAFWAGLTLTLGESATVSMALLCMVFVNFAALISAAPGNIGSFQAAFIVAVQFYGVSAEAGLLVSSALQAAGLSTTLAAGLLARVAMTFHNRQG